MNILYSSRKCFTCGISLWKIRDVLLCCSVFSRYLLIISSLNFRVSLSIAVKGDGLFGSQGWPVFENTHHIFFYFPGIQVIWRVISFLRTLLAKKWHLWASVRSTPVSSILLISFLPRQRRSLGRVCHCMCNNSFVRWNCIIFLIEGTDNDS